MARSPRIEFPGAFYHVHSRGNDHQPIFYVDEDRSDFLSILYEVKSQCNWRCYSCTLMDNHYHLEVETPDGNLAVGMQQLNGLYTQHINRRHDRVGHLFQGRYKSKLVGKDAYALELCRYIALNPVRAKLVEKPEDWKWGSYRAIIGLEEPHSAFTVEWILSQFSDNIDEARAMFRDFVEKGLDKSVKLPTLQEIEKEKRFVNRPGLKEIFGSVEYLMNTVLRDQKIVEAVTVHGYSFTQVAGHLGMHRTRIGQIVKKCPKILPLGSDPFSREILV